MHNNWGNIKVKITKSQGNRIRIPSYQKLDHHHSDRLGTLSLLLDGVQTQTEPTREEADGNRSKGCFFIRPFLVSSAAEA